MHNTKGALLLSRQSRKDCPNSQWIKKAQEAVTYCHRNKLTILSSIGLFNWDIITILAITKKVPVIIVLPRSEICNQTKNVHEFNLDRTEHTFDYIDTNPHTWFTDRDKYIINQASILLPVSLRQGGNLQHLASQSQKPLLHSFTTPYNIQRTNQAYTVKESLLDSSLYEQTREYLIHWTRSPVDRWPDESWYDYYTNIISGSKYPYTAFSTLRRILATGKIIASAIHMPDNSHTVSFSSNSPREMLPLFRWRKRYRMMSFEPYGIGIKKTVAKKIGIVPVTYYQRDKINTIPLETNWQYQSNGKCSDWRLEQEFRYQGDILLKNLDATDLILITRYQKEADFLSKETGYKTFSFTTE